MKILNDAEQMLFDRPPQLSGAERRRVSFELPQSRLSPPLMKYSPCPAGSGFLKVSMAGYFRSARRFFWPRISTSATLLMSPPYDWEFRKRPGSTVWRIPRAPGSGNQHHKFWNWSGFPLSFDGDAAKAA